MIRTIPRSRCAHAAAAAILASAALAGAAAGAERRVHVQGRITDPDGRGLVGQTVRLFKTRRGITLEKFTSGGQIAEAARVTTDDSGFYEIDLPRDRAFDNWYLRFYDPETFDRVQYERPADREITRDLRRGETLRIDVAIARHPAWLEVKRRLEAVGDSSPQGRILRALGLPEKEGRGEGPDGPRDEWWYYSIGVVYYFRDGKAAGYHRFEAVTASGVADGGR